MILMSVDRPWPPQSRRWRLVEQLSIFDRKPTQLPEAMRGGNICDGRCRWISQGKSAASQVHAPQPKIAGRPHPKVFMTAGTQQSAGHADRLAKLWNMNSTIRIGFEHHPESPHDPVVAAAARGSRTGVPRREARDQRLDQFLFQTTGRIRICDNPWGMFGQIAGGRVAPLE
jgi:hypothetical protein